MKFISFLVLVSLNLIIVIQDCYTQTSKEDFRRFNIIVNNGITLNIDGDIYRRDGLISILSVGYLELNFNFMLSEKSEIGLSIGKNKFTYQETIYLIPNDSNSGYVNSRLFRDYEWVAINFTQYFEKNWFIGLKFGTMESEFGFSETLMGLYFGKEIVRVQKFFSRFKVEYNARASINNFHINSNQINLIIGLGFNF